VECCRELVLRCEALRRIVNRGRRRRAEKNTPGYEGDCGSCCE
jgi:hypothetical protein